MEEDASGDSRCCVRQMQARRPCESERGSAATLSDRVWIDPPLKLIDRSGPPGGGAGLVRDLLRALLRV
jgi:hypothetical protein